MYHGYVAARAYLTIVGVRFRKDTTSVTPTDGVKLWGRSATPFGTLDGTELSGIHMARNRSGSDLESYVREALSRQTRTRELTFVLEWP